ncbi:MAG: hypothetical protein ACI8WB_002125 [Phenylobacterium sp.]|jgi:hypothetical protein
MIEEGKLSFVYCEGFHDVAFVAKVLRHVGDVAVNCNKVKDLPPVLSGLISKAITDIEMDNIRVDKPLDIFMPNQVFVDQQDHYLLIYSMGGKTRLEAAKQNIERSKYLARFFTQIRHCFVLDADYIGMDNGGMAQTLAYLSTQLAAFLPQGCAFDHNAQIHDSEYGKLSCFIIADQQNLEGTLEDVLETVIQCDKLAPSATQFCNDAVAIYPDKPIARDVTKHQKAKLTTMAQAFHPGSSLAVAIANNQLIDHQQLINIDCCQALADLLLL